MNLLLSKLVYLIFFSYVFKFVFEQKNSKEASIKEMRDLFQDKTEEILDLLWAQVEKLYGSDNDILEEIYTDKNEKKFPSSVVKPHINDTGKTKPLFGSAINKVKEDKGYKNKDYKDNRGNRSNRDNGNNYNTKQRTNKYDRYNKGRKEEGGNDTFRTVNVGDKKIILRNRPNRSRSGSKEGNRERSREREDNNYDRREDSNYHYQGGYYPQRGFYQGMNFPQRGYGRGYGHFMMQQPRFIDPRR
jgi:hypothetical protein